MGDFDDLTPKYAFTYTGEQLQRWFAEAGLIDVRILPRPTAAYGRMRPNSAWPS